MSKVKNTNGQILMTTEEKNLIIKSTICDKDEELKRFLKLFIKSVEKSTLVKIQNTNNINNRIIKMIKNRSIVEDIVNDSSIEWKQNGYKGKIKQPCELCGNVQSEEKFIILNNINGNTMLVGSSCIDKFPRMDNKLYGLSINTIKSLANKNPEKYNRIVKFNDIYYGGKGIIKNWRKKYEDFDIIFPKEYDDEITNIIKQGNKIYNSYIKGKMNDDEVKKFKSCIDNFNYFYKKCTRYYNKEKDDKYICTKKIAQCLIDNGLKTTLNHIQLRGKIEKGIAKYICHIDFIKRFEDDIRNAFNKFNIKLENLDSENIRFSYKYKSFNPIIFKNSLKSFSAKFSNIFYNKNFDKEYMFIGLNIEKTYANVYEFLGILKYLVKKNGYYFKMDEEMYAKGIVELYRNGFNKYAILSINSILNKNTKVLYLNEKWGKNIVLDNINDIDNWIDKSDKDKFDIGNIAEKFAKEYIEKVN